MGDFWKALTTASGIFASELFGGGDGEVNIKDTFKNPGYEVKMEKACHTGGKKVDKEKEKEYNYSEKHERYWDRKYWKGYDRWYHGRHDLDQDHDGIQDCHDKDDDTKNKEKGYYHGTPTWIKDKPGMDKGLFGLF